MKKRINHAIFATVGFLFLFFPFISQAVTSPTTFKGTIDLAVGYIQKLIPIVAALALLVFFWGIAQLILSAGDKGVTEDGKKKVVYGLIGLFVMISIWGIVALLRTSFGV